MSQYCDICGHVMDSRGFCTWCDEEEWPFDSAFDAVGEIKYEEVEYDDTQA